MCTGADTHACLLSMYIHNICTNVCIHTYVCTKKQLLSTHFLPSANVNVNVSVWVWKVRDDNYVSRDGALTRATSKDYDEFARRMPPTTAMAKINDPVLCSPGLCLCMCKLHLPLLLLVGVKRITVVHGCIRYAILRTKLAVVEVVRGHCAMNHKKSAGGSAREKTHSSIHTYICT